MAAASLRFSVKRFLRSCGRPLEWHTVGSSRRASSLSYCVDLVKRCDHENYLCTLLLPDNIRRTAFAVRAFNLEVSRVQELVTSKDIMPLRYTFWNECIDDIYKDKPVNHPVIKELYVAVKNHKLSKMFLKRLITSRLKQLNNSTFKDMSEMELYADHTNTPVYMLLLEASGIKNINCDHVASHLGIAQGIANLVRGLSFNISEQLILMPMSVLMKHEVSEESVLRHGVDKQVMSNIVLDVVGSSYRHLSIAQSLKNEIPKQQRILFLPAVAIESFLKRLEKSDFDVFSSLTTRKNGLLPLKLYIAKLCQYF